MQLFWMKGMKADVKWLTIRGWNPDEKVCGQLKSRPPSKDDPRRAIFSPYGNPLIIGSQEGYPVWGITARPMSKDRGFTPLNVHPR
ncbi:MAG TPA: hypothetical protein DD856_19005 [Sulfobacillus sp.]|nr:hypothetical protein [Sulfobacillus sp.]